MKKNSVLSIMIMCVIILGNIHCVLANTGEIKYLYHENFEFVQEGEMPHGWIGDFRNCATVKVKNENENSFARIEKQGGAIETIGSKRMLPVVPFRLPQSIQIEDCVAIEMKIRTNSYKSRKLFRVNFDYENSKYDDLKSSDNALFFMHNKDTKNINYIDSWWNTTPPQGAYYSNTEQIWNENEWVDIKVIIYAKEKKIGFYQDGKRVSISGKNIFDLTAPEFNNFNVLENICFTWRNDEPSMESETFDFDDIKIYSQSGPTAKCDLDEKTDVPCNIPFIAINFSDVMRQNTLNSNTIKLYNVDENREISYSGNYNEKKKQYILMLSESLEAEKSYSIKLQEGIEANFYAVPRYMDMSKLQGKKEFTFKASAPKNNDATIKEIMIDSKRLNEFHQEKEDYIIEVPYGNRIETPEIEIVLNDEKATTEIIYPQEFPGVIAVKVTAEDGVTTKNYTLNFKIIGENILKNSGFELGNISEWSANWTPGITINNVHKKSGIYSGYVAGRSLGTEVYGQTISLMPKKTYLLSSWVKPEKSDGVEFEMYPASAEVSRPYREREKAIGSKDGWQNVCLTVNTENATNKVSVTPCAITWSGGIDYYVDDFYLGELIVSNVNIQGETNIEIPDSGEISREYEASLVNQFGNIAGLYDETIDRWEIKNSPKGVKINNDGRLTVTENAVAGEITVMAIIHPDFIGAYQKEVVGEIKVHLSADDEPIPKAKNISATGIVSDGNTLIGNYEYYHINDIEEGETITRWVSSENITGPFAPIYGTNEKTYIVDKENKDKYIAFEVIPKTINGDIGKPVRSNILYKPVAPNASNLKIEGRMTEGSKLKGVYQFYDMNGDAEESSTFRWLQSDSEHGTFFPIENATQSEYILTSKENGKYIKFEVTPVSIIIPKQGKPVQSSAILGAVIPVAETVSIEKINSTTLKGSYTYKHPHKIGEGKSIYQWYKDGILIGEGITYSGNTTGTVTFEVIPVSVEKPTTGNAARATYIAKDSSAPIISGGGGGNSSGGSGVIIPIIPTESPKEESFANFLDIQDHWAKNNILSVVKKGIMSGTKEGEFAPELLITRSEFVVYLIKSFEYPRQLYAKSFIDIKKEDWFSDYVQTALEKGFISKAGDGKFNPFSPITREEITKILTNIYEHELNKEIEYTSKINKFADRSNIGTWAEIYIEKGLEIGLVKGVSENEFAPKNYTSRAECATLICRIMNMIKGEGV